MLFNSYAFILLYLPITLLVYYGLARFRRVRVATAWLVLASFFFYGYWDVRYVPLLFGSICWNYWFGKRIESTARKRIPLTIAVSGNIALLAYFKYTGFFLETINAVLGFSYDISHIVLRCFALLSDAFALLCRLRESRIHCTMDAVFLIVYLWSVFVMKVIILAGGGGTRLFPLSRACYPKQFLRIGAEQRSLFGQTLERFLLLVEPSDIVVVTQEDYFFHVRAELREAGADAAHVLWEPVARNTAPAIALAMAYCRERLGGDEDEVLCVSPSDHAIRPAERFAELVKTAAERAAQGEIVTLGVTPRGPKTGYSYIEAEKSDAAVRRAIRFKEKPTRETAEEYLRAGNCYWNSGMLLFRRGTMREEFASFVPELASLAEGSLAAAKENFAALPSISIDHAVAERSKKMAVAPLSGISWNDVGSFDAIAEMMADDEGNAFSGDVRAKDCKNTMILGDERLVVGMHLSDLLVVDTPDVLLVARKGESQEIREVVEKLKKEGRRETEENVTMYRPWGKYTILAAGDGYKVKRIVINPGQSISLQVHYHRSEHWTVISGTGKLTLNEKEIIFRENESTYIPIGTAHRLENPGKLPLSIIEVQNGKYLEEDDIVRLDDAYGRVAAKIKEDA